MNCKKLVYIKEGADNTSILLGIVIEEGDYLIKFKTAKKEYSLSKSLIKEIVDTNQPFLEEIKEDFSK